ncbi:MAG: TolC family protein [Verrucomicrobia bacterium]|nr:TolC family protein [Verrucomicrobiota bacterium]
MKFPAVKGLLLFVGSFAWTALAQEKKADEKAQVTLPTAQEAVPEFSSRKMTLAECVALALQQNTEIRQAKDEVRRKEGISVEVRSALLPKVFATGNFEYQSKRLNGLLVNGGGLGGIVADDELNWNAGVRVSQLLFDGGAALSRTRAARISESQSMLLLQDTIDRVILDVRRVVYTVLLNRSLIDVQTEAVNLRQQQLTTQQKKFKAGSVTKFNVLTADVELANTLPQLIRAQNTKRVAEVQLARILALDYPVDVSDRWIPPVQVEGDLPYQPISTDLPSSLENAVRNRNDLRAVKKEIEVQRKLFDAAKEDAFVPKIVGSGGYDVIQNPGSSSLGTTLQGPVAAINGTWTLFDGLQSTGRFEQLKAQISKAQVAYEEKQRTVESDVREAVVKIEEAQQLVVSQQKNVEQARESLRLAEARFNVGAGIQLDIINAQSNLTQARFLELQGRYDYNVALALLERATATPFGPKNPPSLPTTVSAPPPAKVNMQASTSVGLQPGQ